MNKQEQLKKLAGDLIYYSDWFDGDLSREETALWNIYYYALEKIYDNLNSDFNDYEYDDEELEKYEEHLNIINEWFEDKGIKD